MGTITVEPLLAQLHPHTSETELDLVRRAFAFSEEAHRGQFRHSQEPYVLHAIAVAEILAAMRLDAVTVAAGLLHDVVEDTLTTIERVNELFGPEVGNIVEGVTKLSAIPFVSQEQQQAENFRKMLLAMINDIRVMLVKLADRLHNMRTLNHLPETRRARVAQETMDIYAPIAHRLGMSLVKNELEELAFKILEPASFEELHIKIESRRQAIAATIDEIKSTVLTRLRDMDVPVQYTDARLATALARLTKGGQILATGGFLTHYSAHADPSFANDFEIQWHHHGTVEMPGADAMEVYEVLDIESGSTAVALRKVARDRQSLWMES